VTPTGLARQAAEPFRFDAESILATLPNPILALDEVDAVRYVNPAAEQFFAASASHLYRSRLAELAPFGSPLLSLVAQVRQDGFTMSEYEVDLGTPRTGPRLVNLSVSPLLEWPDAVLIALQETSIATKMDRQLTHRGAARMVTSMATVLAHEIKNPLSGIRGAAQLVEQNAGPADRELTRLICAETDRICSLVDRMEMFSDKPIERGPVNIHQVLERVRRIAQTGFGARARFVERYDPSLPPLYGNFDQLVQVFLNLVKNACEATPEAGAEITLSTAFRHGVRLAAPGSKTRMRLPLEVTVQDNGPGVPDELRAYLFDPFVTTKPRGAGLGLALVAKFVGDHGGVVECDSRPKRTSFRVMLPLHEEAT
jgi:two-component system nitrogen regulation sensor histidine kinase GlnL